MHISLRHHPIQFWSQSEPILSSECHSVYIYILISSMLHWNPMSLKASQHDDVIKWKYFSRYWPFARGIHRSPVYSPQKGQRCFLWSAHWIKGWANNRQAGNLRRHRAHYDVIVMLVRADNKENIETLTECLISVYKPVTVDSLKKNQGPVSI